MRKFFESDTFLKIASLAIAILLWLYIIVVLDPAVEVEVRDLPIQFVGQEQLEERGISVVSESATTINVKIKGSRKKMGRYDMKTIIAKADMSDLWEVGRHKLPVDIVVPFENAGISSQNHYHVEVQLEKTISKNLEIELLTEGSLAQNHMPGEMSVNPKTVRIKGPESVVGKIEKAGVLLNYGNAREDIKKNLPIQFYDSDERVLTTQDALLKRISQSVTETEATCSVVKLRTVKVSPQFWAGTADEQDLLASIHYTVNPATVQIYGDDEVTEKITEISTEGISVGQLNDNEKVKAKLNVPWNVKVLDDISEVEITLNKSLISEKN